MQDHTRGPLSSRRGVPEPGPCVEPQHCKNPLAGITLALSVLLAFQVPVSFADEEPWVDTLKGFHPYAELTYTDDSNLLRKSDEAAALLPGVPDNDRSDRYLTIGAGFDTEFRISRQSFRIDGRVYQTDYDRFDQFDHTGGDARLLWKWVYGNLWDGRLAYTYNRQLRDFANQEIPEKDMLDRHRLSASANRWLTTRWRAGAEASWLDISSSERENLDKQVIGGGATLDYVSAAKNSVGLSASYKNAAFDSASQNDYQEWYLGPAARWQVTGKTRIDANAGYIQREHDELTERDFDGPVGRLTATWQATGKTKVIASAWREISNLGDEIADYAIVDGISLEPSWAVTAKTTVRAVARYEQEDYQSRGAAVPGIEERVDDVYAYGLWVDWQFLRNGTLSVGYETEDRDSNRELESYDFDVVQARLRIGL